MLALDPLHPLHCSWGLHGLVFFHQVLISRVLHLSASHSLSYLKCGVMHCPTVEVAAIRGVLLLRGVSLGLATMFKWVLHAKLTLP